MRDLLDRSSRFARRPVAALSFIGLTLLVIEFLDEFVFGAREAAWPLIRKDMGLRYVQVGLVLGLPNVAANLIEPVLGILGDIRKRHTVILASGVAFTAALLLLAASRSFPALLVAAMLLSPASGGFVSLSQATLMDLEPSRHEQNMVRWTFAGSAGALAGPVALGAAVLLGAGWRGLFLAAGGLSLTVVLLAWSRSRGPDQGTDDKTSFRIGVRAAATALKRREVVRWLILLECSELLLDIMLGYLALYFVDVVRVPPVRAGLAVAVWTAAGLAGGFLMIPLLERVPGMCYMWASVIAELLLFPGFLLVPGFVGKLLLLALVGLTNAGWYSVLKGRLYTAMPGLSGTVLTVSNVFNLFGAWLPLVLGLAAQYYGLGSAMWLLLAAPLALIAGLPRHAEASTSTSARTGG